MHDDVLKSEYDESVNRVANLEDKLAVALSLLREVSSCFTRDDDLPDNLLPKIDAVLSYNEEFKDE